jgi:hypothetical protein
VVLYDYDPGRSAEVPKRLLGDVNTGVNFPKSAEVKFPTFR